MASHPALRARALTTAVSLISGTSPAIETRGKLSRAPADEGAASAESLTLRVPTPAPGSDEIVEVEIAGQRYSVLDRDDRAPAVGSPVDWQSTTFSLRAAP